MLYRADLFFSYQRRLFGIFVASAIFVATMWLDIVISPFYFFSVRCFTLISVFS